jgi:hypothetical protein
MFEMRLGLVLGKSVGEIRKMPYPEFKTWQLFYQLEPWGWHSLEYYAAVLYAMLYNANRGDKKSKKPKDFYRDMESFLLDKISEDDTEDKLKDMNPDERRAYILAQVRKDFGA